MKYNINVLYFKYAEWEEDFIMKDIFNENDFQSYKINFILYDNDIKLEDLDKYINQFNFIVLNHSSDYNKVNIIVDKINPIGIYFFSDEFAIRDEWYSLQNKTKLFLYQYKHNKFKYLENSFQIPLGYVKGFLGKNSLSYEYPKIKDRKIKCSFIGTLKNDRKEMTEKFNKNFDETLIKTSVNTWESPNKQKILPKDMAEIYKDTIFLLIGRGNKSLDCYRIYEGIVTGAIPVIVAEDSELNESFCYDNYPFKFIKANNWDNAVSKCKECLQKIDELQEIQDFNKKWWKDKIDTIQSKILLSINDTKLLVGGAKKYKVFYRYNNISNINL